MSEVHVKLKTDGSTPGFEPMHSSRTRWLAQRSNQLSYLEHLHVARLNYTCFSPDI